MGEETSTIDTTLLVAQSGWVKSLARHLVRDPDGAEDVAQETLLAALASPPKDAADAKRLRAWLGRVAFNLAHLSRRRNSRRRAREERSAQSERQHSAAETYVNESIDVLVVEAVRGLEEPYRTTVHLRYFEGLSTTEVARRTETSNSAVRKRLWRARGKLRRELDSKHNGERHAWFRALAPWIGMHPPGLGGPLETAAPAPATALPLGTGLGAGWKAAAILPLLAVGLWSGRTLVGTAGEEAREAAAPRVSALTAPRFESGRTPVSLADPDALGGSQRAPEPEQREGAGPYVRIEVTGVESGPTKTDTVPATPLSGYVVDLWGHPLGGVALVDLRDPDTVLGRTGADGGFLLRGLEPPVSLEVRSPGYATVHGARIEPGEEAWVQWVVAAPAVALAGTVSDENGQAVEDALVEIVYADEAFVELPVLVDVSDSLPPRSTTDALGRFALDRVPSGAGISLRVDHPGYQLDLRPVPALSALGLLIELVPRVDLRTLAGVVLDEEQRPLAGVELAFGEFQALTDDLGTFSMQVERESQWALTAFKDGYLPACVDSGPASPLQFHVRMVLRTASRSVHGQVLDEEGQPLAGWLVFAAPPPSGENGEGGENGERGERGEAVPGDDEVEAPAIAAVRTDADGAFLMGGLGGRDYALIGVDPETLLVTEPCQVQADATRVELRALTAEVSELLPGRVLTRDGAPLSDAVVRAELRLATESGTYLATSAGVRTDSRGHFALSRVAAGHVRIRIDHPLAQSVQPALSTRVGDPREFVVDLMRPVRFSGAADAVEVLDAAGRPLALRGFTRQRTRARLLGGRSPIQGVGPAACTVVWYRDGVEVGREALSIHAQALDGDVLSLIQGHLGG